MIVVNHFLRFLRSFNKRDGRRSVVQSDGSTLLLNYIMHYTLYSCIIILLYTAML